MFTAENINCKVESNGNVTVKMHGFPSRKTHKAAIVKFQRRLTKYPDGLDYVPPSTPLPAPHQSQSNYTHYVAPPISNSAHFSSSGTITTGGIVAMALVACIVIVVFAVLGVWLYMKRKKLDENDDIL